VHAQLGLMSFNKRLAHGRVVTCQLPLVASQTKTVNAAARYETRIIVQCCTIETRKKILPTKKIVKKKIVHLQKKRRK
jgi:hypothetical protein